MSLKARCDPRLGAREGTKVCAPGGVSRAGPPKVEEAGFKQGLRPVPVGRRGWSGQVSGNRGQTLPWGAQSLAKTQVIKNPE